MTKESNRCPCFYPSLARRYQTHSSYPTTKTGWLTMKGKQLKELPLTGQLTCFKSILLVPSWRAWGQGTSTQKIRAYGIDSPASLAVPAHSIADSDSTVHQEQTVTILPLILSIGYVLWVDTPSESRPVTMDMKISVSPANPWLVIPTFIV